MFGPYMPRFQRYKRPDGLPVNYSVNFVVNCTVPNYFDHLCRELSRRFAKNANSSLSFIRAHPCPSVVNPISADLLASRTRPDIHRDDQHFGKWFRPPALRSWNGGTSR